MALSRYGGVQASVRDLYPNFTGSLNLFELTVPEQAELDVVSGQAATANVETATGVRPVQRTDLWHVLTLLGVALVLLWLIGRA